MIFVDELASYVHLLRTPQNALPEFHFIFKHSILRIGSGHNASHRKSRPNGSLLYQGLPRGMRKRWENVSTHMDLWFGALFAEELISERKPKKPVRIFLRKFEICWPIWFQSIEGIHLHWHDCPSSFDWLAEKTKSATYPIHFGWFTRKVSSSSFSMGSIDRADLWEALRKLPKDTLELFSLHFEKGMSHDEISKHTDIPVGTVKTKLRRGLIEARKLVREFSDLKGADKWAQICESFRGVGCRKSFGWPEPWRGGRMGSTCSGGCDGPNDRLRPFGYGIGANHTEDCALSSSLATRLEDTIPAFSATIKSNQQPLDKSYQSFPGSAGQLRHASLFSSICQLVMIPRIFQLNWHRRKQNFQTKKRPLLIWNPPNESWPNLMKNWVVN